ncbi:MAG: universal stress protein [Chitinophagaceae bacterium]|nr:MAG: universal stress protein [Chitinophagaceae bacterium]
MRNVLIPTDFTVESLQIAQKALDALDHQPTNIILFHAFDINTQSPERLGGSRRLPYAELLTDEFRNGCRRLKTTYGKFLKEVNIRHMYGSTASVFRNFVDAHDVDLIILPNDFLFSKVTAGSVNPEKFFRKSGVPVVHPVIRKTTIVQPSTEPLAQTIAVLIP